MNDDGTNVERLVVTLEHQGITGRGEAAPSPYYHQSLDSVEAALAQMGPMIEPDPGDIDGVVDRLLERFDDQRAAVSAVDSALHDWLGRSLGKPVWEMLGLDVANTPPTSMTIGLDRLELLAEKVAGAGPFGVLKIKVGTDADADTLRALRAFAPNKKVRVDANCGWPADVIVERMRDVLPFDLELIEQPTRAGEYAAVRRARQESPVPLIADEDCVRPADVARLDGVYDGVNVKLSKCGGIREALRAIRDARRRGMKVMLGCMVETSLGVSAAAHIASLVDFADLDGHLLLADDPFTGLVMHDGRVLPGAGAGLGVAPAGNSD